MDITTQRKNYAVEVKKYNHRLSRVKLGHTVKSMVSHLSVNNNGAMEILVPKLLSCQNKIGAQKLNTLTIFCLENFLEGQLKQGTEVYSYKNKELHLTSKDSLENTFSMLDAYFALADNSKMTSRDSILRIKELTAPFENVYVINEYPNGKINYINNFLINWNKEHSKDQRFIEIPVEWQYEIAINGISQDEVKITFHP